VETTEAFVFLNAPVDGLVRGWYALETVAGRNNQSFRLAIPQATEWQRIGNQINAAMIFAGAGLRKGA